MSKSFKKFIAVVSAIAMVVTSLTVYNSKVVEANATATQNGKIYTVTDGTNDGFTWFTCNGLQIFNEVDGHIGFAWGIAVNPNSISVSINETAVTTYNGNANGVFVAYSQFKDLTDGEYQVVVTATTVGTESEEAKNVTGNATLKIESQGETTTVSTITNPSEVDWESLEWLGNGTSDSANNSRFKAYILPNNPKKLEVTNLQIKDSLNAVYMPNSDSPAKTITVNGVDVTSQCKTEGAQTFVPVSALVGANYNTVVITTVNNYALTAFVYNNKVEEVTEPIETTEAELPVETTETETTTVVEEFDPSTITSWTPVTGSTTLSYYVVSGTDIKAIQTPNMQADRLYAAYEVAGPVKAILNGVETGEVSGVGFWITKGQFNEGYNLLVVQDAYGNNKVTMYVKADKEEETTTKAYVDGEVLVNDSKTVEVPAYEGGDYWQKEFKNVPVTYVAGKKYVAEVVVSSTAAKTIKLVFQREITWDFVDAAAGYEATIQAGNKVKITYVFEATQGTDNGNFDIYLGSVAEATTLVFESKKLTTYTEVPEGVVTGVEVLSAPTVTEYNVTVDGGEATKVAENGTYTLPTDATYGYYCNGEMYKAGAEVTVTTDMAFTSVNTLAVAFDAEGKAGIKLNGANTSGIRYQATVTSNNMDAVSSSAIVEGMLITANDIYENNNSELTLASTYTVKNIVNSGWYKGTIGTYCGSIVNIVESNYIRNFIAKAYVTVNYTDGTSTTVYSGVSKVRSIAEVAQKLIAAGALGNYTTEEQAVIQAFAAAK